MSSKISFEWKGDKILNNMGSEIGKTIKMAALDLKQRSSEQAPVDKGDLRGNASAVFEKQILTPAKEGKNVELPTTRLTARVGYTLPYALVQHEMLWYKHPTGGKAKYLEDPFNLKKKDYIKAIEKAGTKGLYK